MASNGWSKFVNGWLRNQVDQAMTQITYANRPTSPQVGELVNFSDSSVATWGSIIAGGGAQKVLARWNGTNWTVVGQ